MRNWKVKSCDAEGIEYTANLFTLVVEEAWRRKYELLPKAIPWLLRRNPPPEFAQYTISVPAGVGGKKLYS